MRQFSTVPPSGSVSVNGGCGERTVPLGNVHVSSVNSSVPATPRKLKFSTVNQYETGMSESLVFVDVLKQIQRSLEQTFVEKKLSGVILLCSFNDCQVGSIRTCRLRYSQREITGNRDVTVDERIGNGVAVFETSEGFRWSWKRNATEYNERNEKLCRNYKTSVNTCTTQWI